MKHLFVLAAFIIPIPAFSADSFEGTDYPCQGLEGGYRLGNCAYDWERKERKKMEDAYRRLSRHKMLAKDKQFRESQRRWRAFIEYDCRQPEDLRSVYASVNRDICMAIHYQQRVKHWQVRYDYFKW